MSAKKHEIDATNARTSWWKSVAAAYERETVSQREEIARLRAEIAALNAINADRLVEIATLRDLINRHPTPLSGRWQPIAFAPHNRLIIVYATEPHQPPPGCEPLPPMVRLCRWHPEAGFRVCEVRVTTHWMEYEPPAPPEAAP